MPILDHTVVCSSVSTVVSTTPYLGKLDVLCKHRNVYTEKNYETIL